MNEYQNWQHNCKPQSNCYIKNVYLKAISVYPKNINIYIIVFSLIAIEKKKKITIKNWFNNKKFSNNNQLSFVAIEDFKTMIP